MCGNTINVESGIGVSPMEILAVPTILLQLAVLQQTQQQQQAL